MDDYGSLVTISDPKIYGALTAIVVGYFSRNVILTISTGLASYWILIFAQLKIAMIYTLLSSNMLSMQIKELICWRKKITVQIKIIQPYIHLSFCLHNNAGHI